MSLTPITGSKCPAEKGLAKLNDVDFKREENISLGLTDILSPMSASERIPPWY